MSQESMNEGDESTWTPHPNMILKVINGLRALSPIEIGTYLDETATIGFRVGGVGLARVENREDVSWVHLRCNELPVKNCIRHRNVPMRIKKVRYPAMVNPKNAIFYRCDEPLKTFHQGIPAECGYNTYLVYPEDQLIQERAGAGTFETLPVVWNWEQRVAAHAAMQWTMQLIMSHSKFI